MKLALAIAPVLFATACADLLSTTVTFDDDAHATIELKMDIAGNCAGTGRLEDANGVTTWTKTQVGNAETGSCRIDVTWDGDLISLAKMRTDTIAHCGEGNDLCNPDELDLSLSVTLTEAFFDAGEQHMTREQLLAMTARATTGPATLFEMDRSTPLPLVLAADPGVKSQLKDAYLKAGELPVSARGSIELTLADVHRLQAGSPSGVLTVGLQSHLAGSIKAHP